MRVPVCLGVVLGALVAGPPVMAAPADVLRDCAAHAGISDQGLEILQRECPDLPAALTELGYTQILGEGWKRQLNRDSLISLANLPDLYKDKSRGAAPDTGGLRAIVDGLAREHVQNRSRWQIFVEWLRSLLGNDSGRSLSWLDRWLEKLGNAASVMTYAMDGLFLLILIVAAGFIVKELRAAGMLSRTPSSRGLGPPAAAGFDEPGGEPELAGTPLRDQPALLLSLLVNCLSRKGRVQANRHLTHRELVARVKLDETERRRFAQVAAMAEVLMYGRQAEPMDAEAIHGVEQVVDEGRRLLSYLEHSSTAI